MKTILIWITPPLVGAVIGYVTNAIAIKMLFRPLKELRVLGARLPFTPGVLPRERRKLAESIGRMVEQELITPGVLRDRLARKDVREKMEIAVAGYTDTMLEKPLSYWFEERPGDFPIIPIIRNFINSDIFDLFLEGIISSLVKGSEPLSEGKSGTGSWVKSRLQDFGSLFIPAAKNLIKGGLVRDLKNQEKGGLSVYRISLDAIVEQYPGITLKEFISLGKMQKLEVDSFLASKAAITLDENIDGALSSVNVKELVSDRINSLDMLKVEKIILDIMAGQLKWINFFGAIIGAFIGFFQVLLSFIIG